MPTGCRLELHGAKNQLESISSLRADCEERSKGQRYLQLIEAQSEVQDLGELLGQRLLPLQVLSGVVVRLAGQSSQEAVQRCLC